MRRLAGKIFSLNVSRMTGLAPPLPVSVAYSVTHRCNAHCRTCDVGRRGTGTPPYSATMRELSADEWDRVFAALGRAPAWITVTGGEPFLRDDLPELCHSMTRHARPRFVTIATNGFFTGRIVSTAPRLAAAFPDTDFILNISLDGVGNAHDALRGLPGSFEAALATFHALRRQNIRNLHAGFHTVISQFNVEAIPELIDFTAALRPHAHGFRRRRCLRQSTARPGHASGC